MGLNLVSGGFESRQRRWVILYEEAFLLAYKNRFYSVKLESHHITMSRCD
jgi:hypothetical protein